MAQDQFKRKLTTIFSADVAGYKIQDCLQQLGHRYAPTFGKTDHHVELIVSHAARFSLETIATSGGGGIGRNTIGVPRAQQSNELWHRPNYAEQGADDAEECHAIHG
jgi:hypothetical protein